jgi:hypothetical protein
MTWVGVGNVEGRLLRGNSSAPGAAVSLVPEVGIVGDGVAPTHPVTLPVERGNRLILATDGVARRFCGVPFVRLSQNPGALACSVPVRAGRR